MERASQTIAACATVLRPAERAIVRVSGPGTLACVSSLFEPHSTMAGALAQPGVVPGSLRLPLAGQPAQLDAFLLIFRAPRSYTGEDLVEIHLPGAPVVVDVLLRQLQAAGAVPAEPGEFTRRAVLNGRMQLTEAEATLVAIHATDAADLRVGARLLGGETQAALERLRGELTDLLADVEAGLDFSGEDIEIISDAQLAERLVGVACDLARERTLLDPHGAAAHRELNGLLPRVALLGPTGSGKSTLFNRLIAAASQDSHAPAYRALTAAKPADTHTTRDVLTQELQVGPVHAVVGDLPGVGVTAAGQELERMAIDAGLRWARSADVLVFLADVTRLEEAAASADFAAALNLERDPRATAWVWNKGDLRPASSRTADVIPAAPIHRLANVPTFVISAQTGAGCAAFEAWLQQALQAVESPAASIGGLIEHLRAAESAVQHAEATVADGQELAALAIREALRELEHTLHLRLTPDQRTEAMLDRLFARFCLGK